MRTASLRPEVEVSLLQFRLGVLIAAKPQQATSNLPIERGFFGRTVSPSLPLTRMLSAASGYLSDAHEKGGPQAAFWIAWISPT
jgi:hypothetical protein